MSNLRTTMVVLAGSGALLGAFNTPAYVQAQHVPVYYDYMDNGRLRGGRILVDTADASQRSQLGLDLPGGFVAGLWPVTTIINNGPPINRVDVAILGDGYRAVEMVAYAAHVENVVSAFFAQEPLAAYATYFNVHRVDVVSNQSGVDELDLGIFRDTALDMEYGCFGISRLLCINLAKASVAAASAPGVDQILALANSTRYEGAGYPESALATLAGNNVLAVELALHEFGHAFADLADEYDYGDGATYAGGEPFEPNVSIFGAATQIALETKWYRWLDLVNVDTFEGAYYSQFGVYRPTVDSKMRSLGRPFEQVNVEQLVIGMYRIVRPIDNATPPSPVPLPPSSVLFVTPLQPVDHTLDIQWSIDGIDVTGAVENTFTPGSTPLSIGLHDITVTVADNTSWVRDAAARTDYLTDSRT